MGPGLLAGQTWEGFDMSGFLSAILTVCARAGSDIRNCAGDAPLGLTDRTACSLGLLAIAHRPCVAPAARGSDRFRIPSAATAALHERNGIIE